MKDADIHELKAAKLFLLNLKNFSSASAAAFSNAHASSNMSPTVVCHRIIIVTIRIGAVYFTFSPSYLPQIRPSAPFTRCHFHFAMPPPRISDLFRSVSAK